MHFYIKDHLQWIFIVKIFSNALEIILPHQVLQYQLKLINFCIYHFLHVFVCVTVFVCVCVCLCVCACLRVKIESKSHRLKLVMMIFFINNINDFFLKSSFF